jgi:hypothetical protein
MWWFYWMWLKNPGHGWCDRIVSSAVYSMLLNRTAYSYFYWWVSLAFLLVFNAPVTLKCPFYCLMWLSALPLVGARYLPGNILFMEHAIFLFNRMFVTILFIKFWYVFQFFSGGGLLGSFLFLGRLQTIELNWNTGTHFEMGRCEL